MVAFMTSDLSMLTRKTRRRGAGRYEEGWEILGRSVAVDVEDASFERRRLVDNCRPRFPDCRKGFERKSTS